MKITAHVPTQQFGFIELGDLPDDPAEIERAYNRYAEKPIKLVATRVKLQAWIGGEMYYDEAEHEYSNEAGEVYLSGSAYAKSFEEPFDQAGIAAAMAKKYGVEAADIIRMWEMKADISKGLGTALHAAMEYYGRYQGLAKKLAKSANHDNPMVMEAVRQFYEAHTEDAHYEVLIVDHKAKRAGRIDRLEETKDGFYITDFKSDVSIEKRLPIYQKQLSFYAAILEANGVIPAGLRVYHWEGSSWITHQLNKEAVK